jgi:hypothetical protein
MPPVTAKVPGDGTNTLTFKIPGAGMDVETVYVEVDGSGAGGAFLGTLSIADQSGVVIAAKPQDDTMDAATGDSATWALRLNDKSVGSSAGITVQQGLYNAALASCAGVGGTLDASWTYITGDAVLDLTNPAAPTAVAAGLYLFSIGVQAQAGGIAGRPFDVNLYIGTTYPRHQEIDMINPAGGFGVWGQICDHVKMAAGNSIIVRFVNNDNTAHNMGIQEAHVVFIPL